MDKKDKDPGCEVELLQRFMNIVKINDTKESVVNEEIVDQQVKLYNDDGEKPAVYKVPKLKLNTITMVSSLDHRFNLAVMSKYIVLSDCFIGMLSNGNLIKIRKDDKRLNLLKKKPVENADENDDNTKVGVSNKKGRKNGKKNKKATNDTQNFGNQNTFYHYNQSTNQVLNLKLFNNGMIVLVGCKETEYHPKLAISDLLPILQCEGYVTVPLHDSLDRYFTKDKSNWTKTVIKTTSIYDNLAKSINYYLDYKGSDALPVSLLGLRQLQPQQNKKTKYNIPITGSLRNKLLLLFTVYKIMWTYYIDSTLYLNLYTMLQGVSSDIISDKTKFKTKAPENFLELFMAVCDNFTGSAFTLYLKSYMNNNIPLKYKEDELRIALINMGLKLNFDLDRAQTASIMSKKYNQPARFDPDIYQGVQVRYNSSVDCIIHNLQSAAIEPTRFSTNLQKLYAKNAQDIISGLKTISSFKCTCKVVSILIFREGDVIITGAQSFKQEEDAYNFFCNFVLTEKAVIKTSFNLKSLDKRKKGVTAIRHEDCIYLNKESLLSNPRNFMIIKKLGLLDLYST